MTPELFLLIAMLKATVIVAIALVTTAMWRSGAATRHAVLVAAMCGALLVPLLMIVMPPRSLPRPAHTGPTVRHVTDDALLLLLERADGEPATMLPARIALFRWRTIVLFGWLSGASVMLLRIAIDVVAARRIRLRARRHEGVFESDDVSSPAVVGILNPVILLPGGLTDPDVLRAVLVHEQAHIERHDCIVQLIVRITCALYWFNPVMWFAARRIALERERACDDRVLTAGSAPLFYSELLIAMAEQQTPMLIGAAQSMARRAQLEARVQSVLDGTTPRPVLSRRGAAAIVIATLLVVPEIAAIAVRDTPSTSDSRDAYANPQTERVPGTRAALRANTDSSFARHLAAIAAREPRFGDDLAPDRARWALAQMRADGELVEPLIGALSGHDWRVQGYAAWALAISGDRRAVAPLLPLLRHPVWRLRAMTAAALHALADRDAANAMEPMLRDPAWQVRFEAVGYFAALRDERFRAIVEPLRRDAHIAVRSAAEHAFD